MIGLVWLASVVNQLPAMLSDDRIDRGDGRHGGRVNETALDDDLDVHQPVADDRRGKRERHQPRRTAVSSNPAAGVNPSANGSA